MPWLSRMFELQDPAHRRLLPMEGLRGAAVAFVFLQHYGAQAQEIGMAPGPSATVAALMRGHGNFGVELFFVLSGFLIYGTLVGKAPPFGAFMRRRAWRIYPAFLVVFALALAGALAMPSFGKLPPDPAQAAVVVAMNLLFLPGLLPMEPIVTVAWSLSYEMFFYLVTGAAVLGAGLHVVARERRVALLGGTTALFLLACTLLPWMPFRMLPFFAGMLLAERVGRGVPAWLGWAAPLAVMVVAGFRLFPGSLAGEIGWTAGFFCLCAVCFRDAGVISRVMTWTPLRWLGNMSYSYYLVHGMVVRIAMLVLRRLLPAGLPDWLFWALVPTLFAATLAASAVMFLLVERPLSLNPRPARTPAPV